MVIRPAIRAGAAATMAIDVKTLAPITCPAASSFGNPESDMPLTSVAVPMISGLRAMM